MLISQQDDLVISAQHEDLPDSFIIEIEAAKVQHLLNEFRNDFSLMASHLKIMNKRMVLLNPVSIFLFIIMFSFIYILYRNLSPNKMKVKVVKKVNKKKLSLRLKRWNKCPMNNLKKNRNNNNKIIFKLMKFHLKMTNKQIMQHQEHNYKIYQSRIHLLRKIRKQLMR